MVARYKRKSKYNVSQGRSGKQNRTCDGIVFDSRLEMKYYRDVVCVGIKEGLIVDCQRQVKFELQPRFKYKNKNILPINYYADFVITYSDGSVIVWDTKGLADATAKLKKKMFHYVYPDIDYRWVGWSKIDGGWTEYDKIEKRRRERRKLRKKK